MITVRRSLYRGTLGVTKSEKAFRDVPFGETVAQAVRSLENGTHNRGEFLFLWERGKVHDPRVVERLGFARLIARLKLEPFTWRSFRRSGATALHVNNVPLKVQQEILGHSSPDMSLLYTEADLAHRRRAIELLEQNVFGVQNRKSMDANWTRVGVEASPFALSG